MRSRQMLNKVCVILEAASLMSASNYSTFECNIYIENGGIKHGRSKDFLSRRL